MDYNKLIDVLLELIAELVYLALSCSYSCPRRGSPNDKRFNEIRKITRTFFLSEIDNKHKTEDSKNNNDTSKDINDNHNTDDNDTNEEKDEDKASMNSGNIVFYDELDAAEAVQDVSLEPPLKVCK